MKKRAVAGIVGIIMAVTCVFSAMGAAEAFGASDTGAGETPAAAGSTEATIHLEPGIYPIDNENYLRVFPDHTFIVVHCSPTESS